MPPSWRRFPGRSSIVLLSLALLLMVLEHVNGRFWLNDFRVYYDAANALRHGEPLYGVPHGLSSGYFKYAPVMAMLYIPLSLLPYALAATIQYLLIAAAFVACLHMADRLVRVHLFPGRSGAYAPVLLSALVVAVHLHRELHLGNINVLLLWLLLMGLNNLLNGRDAVAGLFIGIAALAKPHFIVLMPLLLFRDRWKSCASALGILVLGVLLPMLLFGPSTDLALHREWVGEMAKHNASLIYTGGEAYNSVDTVYSFLHRAILHRFVPFPSQGEAYCILGLIAMGFGAVVLWKKRKDLAPTASLLVEYVLLVALVPSITLTDTNHFLLATPLVVLIMHHLLPRSEPRWLALVAIPALLAFGGNWGDALGPFSDTLIHYGVLGMANIALLVIGILLFLRQGSNPSAAATSIHETQAHA